MKRKLKASLSCIILFSLCACAGSSENNSLPSSSSEILDNNTEQESNASVRTEKNSTSITTASSSIDSPLELDVWGTAAKYCTAENNYVNVPIKITSVRRGKDVASEVKTIADKSSFISYFEPDENEEYAIADYEISLDGFPVDKGGTLIDISAYITGTDGEMIKLDNGSYWSTTAASLNQENYYYEGTVKGSLAFRIIKNRTDYLIVLGETGETQAFFKGV